MTRAEFRGGDDSADRLDDELDRMVRGEDRETGAASSGFAPTIDRLFALGRAANAAGTGPNQPLAPTRQSLMTIDERRFIRPLPIRIRRFPMAATSTAAIIMIVFALTFSTFQYLGTAPSEPSQAGSSLSARVASTPEATPDDGIAYPGEPGVLEGCTVPVGDILNVPWPLSVYRPGASTPVPGDTASPVSIVIERAGIDARVEKRNIIDGVMEPPSGPDDMAWYQQTDLLGEVGNVVLVGYADYRDVGPAVFANVYDLAEGDEIVTTGIDGNTYVYAVESVDLYDVEDLLDDTANVVAEPSSGQIIGPTGEASITLITCGGEFDYERAEYLSRVVVRGTLMTITVPEATPVPAR